MRTDQRIARLSTSSIAYNGTAKKTSVSTTETNPSCGRWCEGINTMSSHPLDKRCECDSCLRAQTMTPSEPKLTRLPSRDNLKDSARAHLNMRKATLPSTPAAKGGRVNAKY